jgi:hypothetical protein
MVKVKIVKTSKHLGSDLVRPAEKGKCSDFGFCETSYLETSGFSDENLLSMLQFLNPIPIVAIMLYFVTKFFSFGFEMRYC